MSGLRPNETTLFHRRLHARGETIQTLADKIGASRPALTRVLNGSRRRGPIWARVVKLLTTEEVHLLDVAQCHPWNSKRLRSRPRWARVAAQFGTERKERLSA